MENVTFSGLQDLEEIDQEMVKKLCEEHYPKIQRVLHADSEIKIHIKSLENEGHRHKYEITFHIMGPGMHLESKTDEWDLATAIHRGFDELEKEAKKRFHES